MDQKIFPEAFCRLCQAGCIKQTDLRQTRDGFFLVYKSLADLLAEREIFDFPDSEGTVLPCSSFFDDWFLYAVTDAEAHTYSLLKLREQEHDAENGAPTDGDTPGVTVSFIAFSVSVLMDCLAAPDMENRQRLGREINRVVAYRGQLHHKALKSYFVRPQAQGAYLVAELYTRHIAAMAKDGWLETPECYKQILRQSSCRKNKPRLRRLPAFVEALNEKAGHTVCDKEKIYIKDSACPDEYECAAILATHAGNTSLYSFAAEVEYHARFLFPLARLKLPFYGRSVYDSAIRADMSAGDTELQGPAPFYRNSSRIVRRQRSCHEGAYTEKKSAL